MKPAAKILVVDDQAIARKSVEALLFNENYQVEFAADGAEGLAKVAELLPDTILLDVMMPGMDGYEVCQRLKSNPLFQAIPVIMLTALHDKQNLVRGLDAGADEFLTKPVGGLELRARVRSMLRLKQQHDRLVDIMRLREDLSHMVAHDMRNPLAAVLGHAQLLLNAPALNARAQEHAGEICKGAFRLKHFIDDYLVQAKMEHDHMVLNRTAVEFDRLVARVAENHALTAQSRNTPLTVAIRPGSLPPVQADAALCERVLDNLLSNAIKYSPSGHPIAISAEPLAHNGDVAAPGAQIRLRFADQGPGIPSEYRDRIFDKYEIVVMKQANTAQIGLGLAFCKLVVDAHGGRLYVEPNQPQGSIFTVEL
jgi:two-component system, sensor histidine kinase and response regulator